MRRTRVGSVNERFAQRFAMDAQTGCWNWTGRVSQHGYGLIAGEVNGKRYAPKGQPLLAHRVAWLIFKGEIPEGGPPPHGYVVMHTCDNRLCVNPAHLQLGTQADNVQDMLDKGRKVSGVPSGVKHWNSSFKDQADIDLICSTVGKTKELAERFGVDVCTIKRIRRRSGVVKQDAEKYVNKPLSQEAIDHIRSTPPGTRGLGKLYGVGKTTIANIRKGLTHAR
jgi:hypothetical protein